MSNWSTFLLKPDELPPGALVPVPTTEKLVFVIVGPGSVPQFGSKTAIPFSVPNRK